VAEITAIESVAPQVVYNLDVDTAHCFAVNGGLIVHNCIRYAYLLRPWLPEVENPEDVKVREMRKKLDPLSRFASEEVDELEALAAKFNRPNKGTDNSA
jgi:hypothetical protein